RRRTPPSTGRGRSSTRGSAKRRAQQARHESLRPTTITIQGRPRAMHLHMLPPSVNNLSVRVFLRAAGLPFKEENAWGKTRSPEFMAKVPSHLTPAIEHTEHPRGAMWESCAIMMYLANKHRLDDLYPTDPGRRALVDSANFYLTGTLYPLVG